MSLKALAHKILLRDGAGTISGTIFHSLSQKTFSKSEQFGTVINFRLTDELRERRKERTAAKEADDRTTRQKAGAYDDMFMTGERI